MDATRLEQSYFARQIERVEAVRAKIAGREMVVTDGRAIPEDGALPIGIGRRLSAAVMFIDICGFSARMSESKQEQENLLRILALFFAELIRIIEDYGGTVEKNTGDGLMAYFPQDGGQAAHQNQRAVASAMTICYAANALLNPIIRFSNLPPLDFRICIDHGSITIAEVGAARRFRSFVAIGSTANIASKLLKIAKKNSILLGEAVLAGLPQAWLGHCIVSPTPTGFVYTQDRRPYPCYEFTARWTGPVQ